METVAVHFPFLKGVIQGEDSEDGKDINRLTSGLKNTKLYVIPCNQHMVSWRGKYSFPLISGLEFEFCVWSN